MKSLGQFIVLVDLVISLKRTSATYLYVTPVIHFLDKTTVRIYFQLESLILAQNERWRQA